MFKPPLTALSARSGIIPIFTTNYDWTFEHMEEEADSGIRLVDGFRTGGLGGRWDRSMFDAFRPDKEHLDVVLFKLHGSTSWYRGPGRADLIRKVSMAAPKLLASEAVLIYPTQVKAQAIEDDPFATAYEYFRETLKHAKLCIVIGFSFRDPAVNKVFHDALGQNKQLKLALVEPNRYPNEMSEEFQKLLVELGQSQNDWKQTMRVITLSFGGDSLLKEELRETVEEYDNWDTLNSWVTKRTATASTRRH